MPVACRLLMLSLILLAPPALAQYDPAGCLSAEEEQLLELVNEYRQENGKAPVPYSHNLMLVGQSHIENYRYAKYESGELGSNSSCNLHTWYEMPAQPYTTCCYTADHAEASCMWNKPREISANAYTATGYENAAAGYADVAGALNGWKGSPGHNDVILNQGIWANQTWNAMGVGVDEEERWYFLWFANQVDPSGNAQPCATAAIPWASGVIATATVSPNPFNPTTTVHFELSRSAPVTLTIHDLAGRRIRGLDLGAREVGVHSSRWDGRDDAGQPVASGVYVVQLQAGDEAWTRKVALLK